MSSRAVPSGNGSSATAASPGSCDSRSLHALKEEGVAKRLLCVCLESRRRRVEGIDILPLEQFLRSLWNGEFE